MTSREEIAEQLSRELREDGKPLVTGKSQAYAIADWHLAAVAEAENEARMDELVVLSMRIPEGTRAGKLIKERWAILATTEGKDAKCRQQF